MCRSHQDSSRHISYIVRLCPTWPRLQILGEQTACNFLVPDNSSEVHSDAVVSKIERKLSMFGKIFRCGRPGVAILMSFPSICGRMDCRASLQATNLRFTNLATAFESFDSCLTPETQKILHPSPSRYVRYVLCRCASVPVSVWILMALHWRCQRATRCIRPLGHTGEGLWVCKVVEMTSW